MTREEYIALRAESEGMTVEEWNTLYDVYPCTIDDPNNQGWQATEKGKEPILQTE